MTLCHFSVTQLRAAATCPRIHYFDSEYTRRNALARPHQTRVWLPSDKAQVGGGTLFHHVVERFNRRAAKDRAVLAAIESAQGEVDLQQALLRYVNYECIDLEKLATYSVPLRQAFISALSQYFEELVAIINYALSNEVAASDVVLQLFGDSRRRVDVTFHVNEADQAHVTGTIDYVFYDWRTRSHRVVDYKLLSPDHANRDLFQVSAYALMHHHQHGTQPDVALFYRHPVRRVVERKWDDVMAERHKVYDLLASMIEWARFDGTSGLRPPGDVTWCAGCKWNKRGECERRLGPKHEGDWSHRWQELASMYPERQPSVESRPIEELGPEEEPEEAEFDEMDEDAPAEATTADETSSSSTAAEEAWRPAATEDHLQLGALVDRPSPVSVHRSAVSTHIAVVGAAGSGKTWTAKVIAEEVVAAGTPVIAVDPQGDLVQLMLERDEANLSEDERVRQRAYFDRVEVRVFTPGTSHGIRMSLSPLRLPTAADLARIEKPDRRREEEEGMLQVVAANLTSLASIGGEEDSQRTFLYQVLSRLDRERTLEIRDIIAAIVAPESFGIDDSDSIIKKAERDKLARKLNAFVIGPARNLFTGGVPLDLQMLTQPTVPGKVPLNVIYLNALTDDDQKHFFLASLASEIYRWMVTSLEATQGKPNLLFYIDEARDWIPAGTKATAAKQPLIRLFTQGRKYGVGCLLCTQSPRSVDYNVFGNCSTKIIGRMEAAQDVDRIAEWFTVTGAAPQWIAQRKGAAKGTFVGRWPNMPAELEGAVFKGRLLYSSHEGAWSPDRVEREVDATDMRQRPLHAQSRGQ